MGRIPIHEFKVKGLKKYYGASKRVYRNSHLEKLLKVWSDLHYLSELRMRTRLIPCNKEFLHKKAIPAYNATLKRLKMKYPNIAEFHNYKSIAE